MSARNRWVFAIISLLAINLIAGIVLLVVANSGEQSQVLPSYRSEGR